MLIISSCTDKTSKNKHNLDQLSNNINKVQEKLNTPLEKRLPEGCPKNKVNTFYASHLGKIHKLKNGAEIWLCGRGSLDDFSGQIFHKKAGDSDVTEVGHFGGMRQLWGPLAVDRVKVVLEDSLFKILQLIPYRNNLFKPSVQTTFTCNDNQCTKKNKLNCTWAPLKRKPPGIFIKKINQYLSGKSEAVPSNKDLLESYFDALDGHQASLNFFLMNKILPEKIKNHIEDYGGQDSTFEVLRRYINDLSSEKCI